jgi:hypothetical protein
MENEYAFSIKDRHPVSRGHALIIPKKHVATVFELPVDDYHACFDLIRTVREHLEPEHRPDGFNTRTSLRFCVPWRITESKAQPRTLSPTRGWRGGLLSITGRSLLCSEFGRPPIPLATR